MLSIPIVFSAAVEGPTDEAVLRRIVEQLGGQLGNTYGKNGKRDLLKHVPAYNRAAQYVPWIVLVDLDQSAECAPPARDEWLSVPSQYMTFRIAVRKVESWLLGDRETVADFLGVPVSAVPARPEELADPKQAMVSLARGTRRREIRADMVPRPHGGRSEGPAYTSRMIEYAQGTWRPDVAAEHANSLQRLRRRLTEYIERPP